MRIIFVPILMFLLSCSPDPVGKGLGENGTDDFSGEVIKNYKFNEDGSENPNKPCKKPAAPTNLSAQFYFEPFVEISWQDYGMNEVDYYEIYECNAKGKNCFAIGELERDYARAWIFYYVEYSDLYNLENISYKVRAVNSCEKSSFTDIFVFRQ